GEREKLRSSPPRPRSNLRPLCQSAALRRRCRGWTDPIAAAPSRWRAPSRQAPHWRPRFLGDLVAGRSTVPVVDEDFRGNTGKLAPDHDAQPHSIDSFPKTGARSSRRRSSFATVMSLTGTVLLATTVCAESYSRSSPTERVTPPSRAARRRLS